MEVSTYKSISEPNFTKSESEGKISFGHFFWKWSSRRAEKDATEQIKVLSYQEVGQKRKMVIKIEFTPLSLSRPQHFSL